MTAQQMSGASAAELNAARLLLARMGISPADLLQAAPSRPPAPTFAEYIPAVSAAVSAGTRRVYGSYWNRISTSGGSAGSTSPPRRTWNGWPSTSAPTWCGATPAADERGRAPDRGAALPVQPRRRRRPHRRGGQPGPQGRQAAATAQHPPGGGRHPTCGDQPGRRHHRQRPRPGQPAAATAHRDRLPPRRRAGPAPGRPRPGPVPDPAAGEGRHRTLAAGLAHPDDPPAAARPGAARSADRAAAALPRRHSRSPTAATTISGSASASTCRGWRPSRSAPTGCGTPP